ncbi:MAG: hypothetical protein ABI452_01075 [Candidatus Limnocylindrales bacterium]
MQLPEGVSREMIVALARELAAEMARSARPTPGARPLSDARPARMDSRQSKPDARPMRFVYGAGAVAAMSVMAVGLVQPDFAATADQSGASDPTAEPNAVAQVPATTVQHVTQYVQLKPGETAPPGAKVIAANAPTPRIVVTHNTPSGPAAQPVARPAARPPAPKPVTRQSGKPRP